MTTLLNEKNVSILNVEDGVYQRKPYYNTMEGRTALTAEQPPEIVAEVMAMWGDTPTIPDDEHEPTPEPTPAEQAYSLKQQIADTDYKIIKCSECQLANIPLPYDIMALHGERQALRDKINVLEAITP